MMPPDAWLTVAVISGCFLLLATTRHAPDLILMAGVTVLLLAGVITPEEALAGLANEGLATVGVLFIVANALSQAGVISWISYSLLGRPRTLRSAQLRLMAPAALCSAFLNNTPVVAMLVPAVSDWAKRLQLPPSQLMMPLSYAAIVGGSCTLIGTSTNLVVNGLLVEHSQTTWLSLFELAWIGIPCTLLTFAYVTLTSPWLLPYRRRSSQPFADTRQYIVEVLVEADCPLIGSTIERGGLRHLPGMYLIEIERDGKVLPAVSPHETLQANDRLVFTGNVDSVVDLQKIRGLQLASDQQFKLDAPPCKRCLVEVVVSQHCPLVGKSIRAGRFRNHYQAVVIAVARDGSQLKQKIGDVVLKAGDTLLLEARPGFIRQQRHAKDFMLVSRVENAQPIQHENRYIATAILLGMVALVAFGWLNILPAAMLASGLLIISRCTNGADARQSIDWQVLVVIAASIALGNAMAKTGAAQLIADQLIALVAGNAWATLAMLFALGALITAVVSNITAALLLFPIAVSSSEQLGVSLLPFAVTLMIAASACFATPIGYQTNLLVYGPGGYRFTDYLKCGLPLTVLIGMITVALAPKIWAF